MQPEPAQAVISSHESTMLPCAVLVAASLSGRGPAVLPRQVPSVEVEEVLIIVGVVVLGNCCK